MPNTQLNQVEQVLDEQVRPGLGAHGGNVRVESLEEGVLKLRMLGPCSNCPSAVYETETTFAEIIMASVPGIDDVLLVTGVSDDLIAAAKTLMRRSCS